MKKIKKYFKLYFTYAKLSLMGKFAYKANIIIGIFSFLISFQTTRLCIWYKAIEHKGIIPLLTAIGKVPIAIYR